MSRSRHIIGPFFQAQGTAYGCFKKWVDTNRKVSIEGHPNGDGTRSPDSPLPWHPTRSSLYLEITVFLKTKKNNQWNSYFSPNNKLIQIQFCNGIFNPQLLTWNILKMLCKVQKSRINYNIFLPFFILLWITFKLKMIICHDENCVL